MSLNDDLTRPADRVLKQPGLGIDPQRSCWGCGQSKSQRGGRYRGRLKLWYCAGCSAPKAEASAPVRAGGLDA